MEVVLLLSVERDFQEAYDWVEEHRRGREQFFLQDVELRLENRGRYRRLLIPRYRHEALPERGRGAAFRTSRAPGLYRLGDSRPSM